MSLSRSRICSFFFLLGFVFLSRLYAAEVIDLTHEEKAWIAAHPVVTLGADYNWPPFEFIDEQGKHRGIAADLLALVSQRTGLAFRIKAARWSEVMALARAGQLDGLACAVPTPDRRKFLDFTTPYVRIKSGIVVRKNRHDIDKISDLAGKSVALNSGSYLHEWMQETHPQIRVYPTHSNEAALEAVSYGKADAYIGNLAVSSYIIQSRMLTNLKVVGKMGEKITETCFATQKTEPILGSIMQKALESIGFAQRQEIQKRWYLFSAVTEGITLSKEEKLWFKAHPELTFTGDPNWLPFEAFNDKGEYIGIVADYIKELEKMLPVTFRPIKVATWQQALSLAQAGEIDVISDVIGSEGMRRKYRPITPYLTTPIVIVMRSDHEFVNDLDDIENKRIAIIKGYGYIGNLKRRYPEIRFREVDNADILLEQLSSGKIDAAVLSMPKAGYLIRTKGYANLKIVGKTSIEMQLSLFVKTSEPLLQKVLDRAVRSISKSKSSQILKEWQEVKFADKPDHTLLFQLAGMFLLILLGTLYWNRKLSNEVARRVASEAEAIELNRRLSLATSLVKIGVWELDLSKGEGVYHFDDMMIEIYGLPKDRHEMNRSELLAMVHPDDHVTVHDSDTQLRKHGGTSRIEFRIIRPDGQIRHLYAGRTISEDGRGRRVKITGVNWDITELKSIEASLKQSEAQMRTLIDNIPLQMIVTAPDGTLMMANPQAFKDHGVDLQKLSQYNIVDFYDDPAERESVLTQLREKGSVKQKIIRFKSPGGQLFSLMVSILPITFDQKQAFLSIAVDMTERLAIERELAEAKVAAERASRAKSEFLANMSHEIRTPMNAIIGFTELLNDQMTETRLKSYVKTIQKAGQSLLRLIDDILDLSKIEAGKLEITKVPVNLFDLCDEIGSIFMMSVRNKGLELIIDVEETLPQSLLIDEVRLRQVLVNLLGNALKFTSQGQIRLRVRAKAIHKHLSKVDLEIIVEDTGVGIPDDQQARIFETFEQTGGQDSRTYGGTGLGLSISKRLSEMMGGEIMLESEVGKGSVFTVLLFAVEISSLLPPSQRQGSDEAEAGNYIFEPATILVVDDVEDNRQMIVSNFEGTAVSVKTAADGLEAVDAVGEETPDLILMDIRMPGMDGYEATAKIKETLDVPVIALSASVMKDSYGPAQFENFDGYLRKPMLKRDLFAEIGRFLPYHIEEAKAGAAVTPVLSAKARQHLDYILQILEEDIVPLYKRAASSNNLVDIAQFARKLKTIAKSYDVFVIEAYAAALTQALDAFDVDSLKQLLNNFPSLERQLADAA